MATSDNLVVFSRDDLDLIVEFAGCSLDEKPGSNWVESAGGLPDYVCRIAKAIKRTGKSTSQAIAIAVSRVKKWAAGGDDVDADTRAKAAAALAEWEKLKAKGGKKKVKASRCDTDALALSAFGTAGGDFVVADVTTMLGADISDTELHQLTAAVPPCHRAATNQVLLSISDRPSAVEQILARRTGT